MTESEKLQRDMDTLRESIKLDKVNLHQRTPQEIPRDPSKYWMVHEGT